MTKPKGTLAQRQKEAREQGLTSAKLGLAKHELLRYYASGLTMKEIAVKSERSLQRKVSAETVRTVLRKLGIASARNHGQHKTSRNPNWKGDQAKYMAMHRRIDQLKGKPKKCAVCGATDPKRRYDWANVSGNLADPDGYLRMCRSCHTKHDREITNKGLWSRQNFMPILCPSTPEEVRKDTRNIK